MKLKNLSRHIATALIILSLSACSDKEDDISASDLGVTPISVNFNENKTATVTVDFAGKWVAALSDDSWCQLDKLSGEGKGDITITLKPRTGIDSKETSLTISAATDPSLKKVLKISLDGIEFYADPILVEFGYGDNKSYEIDVVCPGEWTATLSDDSWCTIDTPTGNGSGKLKITSHYDLESFGNKSTVLTITSTEIPSLNATVDVKQFPGFVHGGCLTLNKATKGKGIDFVILGEAFSKAEMGIGGHWQKSLKRCVDAMFRFEPFASFREYFNVYAVATVSATNVIKTGIPSDTYFGFYYQGNFMGGELSKATDLAYNNSPVITDKGTSADMYTFILLNDKRYGGYAIGSIGLAAMWEDPRFTPEKSFEPLLTHEFLGHAFGKLADEYYGEGKTISDDVRAVKLKEKQELGHWGNVEFTKDSTKFVNQNWRKLLDLKYPDVSIIQGGHYNQFGVWRSIDDNMMRDQLDHTFFGPVNREILVRTIYQKAGLTDYSLEKFIEYDKKNLK